MLGSWTRAEEFAGCALIDSCASGHTVGRIGMRYSTNAVFRRKFVYCEAFKELYIRAAAHLVKRGRNFVLTPDQIDELELGAT